MRLQLSHSLAKWNLAKLFLATAFVALFGFASVAEAQNVRNPIERRLHPGRGFFVDRTPQVSRSHAPVRTYRQPSYRQPSFLHQNWSPFNWSGQQSAVRQDHQPSAPAWGWQRSSRAELHHPAPINRCR